MVRGHHEPIIYTFMHSANIPQVALLCPRRASPAIMVLMAQCRRHTLIKEPQGPGQCGSVVLSVVLLVQFLQGHWFDSWSEHIPRLCVCSGEQLIDVSLLHRCLCLSLSVLSLFSSL